MNQQLTTIIPLFFILVCLFLYAFFCRGGHCETSIRRRRKYDLLRHSNNPIISPLAHREWETEGTFNPGAIKDSKGWVHLFYRALGRDGISRIGHSKSPDGKWFPNRSMYPVYDPVPGYGKPEPTDLNGPHEYDPLVHISGGGWGGSEDPRTVQIGDRMYMTYTAFEGWENMRIAVTSIAMKDLEQGRWKWKRPTLISPVGARAKNWLLFPEKIRGKYAILHGIAPRIMVAYVDSPDMVPDIRSSRDHGGYGIVDQNRKGFWDKTVKGAGTPPIKTKEGWLVLYHAINDGKYKVGAMLLDLQDPAKVLYRSPEPILSPDIFYENDGKPGVVYASGAVVKDGKLLVYYGGGDRHTCVAETPLEPLITWLMLYGKV